jgi:hypothetical protein
VLLGRELDTGVDRDPPESKRHAGILSSASDSVFPFISLLFGCKVEEVASAGLAAGRHGVSASETPDELKPLEPGFLTRLADDRVLESLACFDRSCRYLRSGLGLVAVIEDEQFAATATGYVRDDLDVQLARFCLERRFVRALPRLLTDENGSGGEH